MGFGHYNEQERHCGHCREREPHECCDRRPHDCFDMDHHDCEREAPICKHECECPVKLADRCVLYSGENLVDIQVSEGMNMYDVITRIDDAVGKTRRKMLYYIEQNQQLIKQIKDLRQRIINLEK